MSKYYNKVKECNYPECTNKYYGNGLCGQHYRMTRYDKHERVRKYLNSTGPKHYTPAYASYMNMIQRCYNKNNQIYKYYGDRGIVVCDRWMESFDNFVDDMGESTPGLTLDRIDVNGNYEADNCRWATKAEQNKNKRPIYRRRG